MARGITCGQPHPGIQLDADEYPADLSWQQVVVLPHGALQGRRAEDWRALLERHAAAAAAEAAAPAAPAPPALPALHPTPRARTAADPDLAPAGAPGGTLPLKVQRRVAAAALAMLHGAERDPPRQPRKRGGEQERAAAPQRSVVTWWVEGARRGSLPALGALVMGLWHGRLGCSAGLHRWRNA